MLVNALIESKLPLVIPLHPRTKKRLRANGMYGKLSSSKVIQVLSPQGYLDFLVLMRNARFVITDSGGIQEEATTPSLMKKVFVLRKSTERLEAVESGIAELLVFDKKYISRCLNSEWQTTHQPNNINYESPYGDGYSSKKIMKILRHASKPV